MQVYDDEKYVCPGCSAYFCRHTLRQILEQPNQQLVELEQNRERHLQDKGRRRYQEIKRG